MPTASQPFVNVRFQVECYMMSFGPSNFENNRALILVMTSYEWVPLIVSFMALNKRSLTAVGTLAIGPDNNDNSSRPNG